MSANSPSASVVTIVQLTSHSPSSRDGRQNSYSPANASSEPSRGVMKYGCFPATSSNRFHSNQPSAGTRQRRAAAAFLNAPDVTSVSARALSSRDPIEGSFAQDGISPQRITFTSRSG